MWQVVGHDAAVNLLARSIADGRAPQAVLLTGPFSVGKTTLALELAKAVNCVGADLPCQRCGHCRRIGAGTHPDVSLIESAEGKDLIPIGQVRALREAAALRPYQGRRNVYIISRAEELTPQAADALLKTLEEPPPEVVIVLTATDAESLPETVVSRCRVIPLRPLSTPMLREELVARGADGPTAERLARHARGSIGWALRALKHPRLAARQEELVERLSTVLALSPGERLDLAEALVGERGDRDAPRRNLELLTMLTRDALLLGQNVPSLLAEGEAAARLRCQAERIGPHGLRQAFKGLETAMRRIDANVDPRLTMEAMLLSLP